MLQVWLNYLIFHTHFNICSKLIEKLEKLWTFFLEKKNCLFFLIIKFHVKKRLHFDCSCCLPIPKIFRSTNDSLPFWFEFRYYSFFPVVKTNSGASLSTELILSLHKQDWQVRAWFLNELFTKRANNKIKKWISHANVCRCIISWGVYRCVLRCDNNYTSLASKGNQAGVSMYVCTHSNRCERIYIWVEIPWMRLVTCNSYTHIHSKQKHCVSSYL